MNMFFIISKSKHSILKQSSAAGPCTPVEPANGLLMTRMFRISGSGYVHSVSDFILFVSVYEDEWPVLSLTITSSHRLSPTVSVLIIVELIRWCTWSSNLEQLFFFFLSCVLDVISMSLHSDGDGKDWLPAPICQD